MNDKNKESQQSSEADSSSQKAQVPATPTKSEPDKKEDDRSDWVEIESGLGIDE